jgi:exopolysaccharide production protein ExoQ
MFLLSYGLVNPAYYGGTDSAGEIDVSPQQYVVMVLWVCIIGLTLCPGVMKSPLRYRGLLLPFVFLCWSLISPLWSYDPVSTGSKAIASVVIAVGVWRLTSVFSLREFIDLAFTAMFGLLLVSLVLVIIDPTDAIGHLWRADRQSIEPSWQGLFGQKQTLGMVAATFTFLAVMRLVNTRRWTALLPVGLGVLLLVGSDSRGGGITALLSCALLLLGRRNPRFRRGIILLFPLCLLAASFMFCCLLYSGRDLLFSSFDLSERTYVWSYALERWSDTPLLGFGLNGFWTEPYLWWGLVHRNGWAIADFHSGYLAVLVETGLIGAALFIGVVVQFCRSLWLLVGQRKLAPSSEMALGLVLSAFVLNISETLLLRSTNGSEVMFIFILIVAYSEASDVRSPRAAFTPSMMSQAYR